MNGFSRLFIIINILFLAVLVPFSVKALTAEAVKDLEKIQSSEGKAENNESEKNNVSDEETVDNDKEKLVIISIINFGRENPFIPYDPTEKTKVKKEKGEVSLQEIPLPPVYSRDVSIDVRKLMQSRVNGILYDPQARSVAIVNIDDNEYMVHRGDIVENIEVYGIGENSVTLKSGANTYTVGVGEIIEGAVLKDIVERKQKMFAGAEYNLPELNLEE